jgi:hypothetical protein
MRGVNDMKLNIIAERHEQHGDHPHTSRRDAPEEIPASWTGRRPWRLGLRGDSRLTQRGGVTSDESQLSSIRSRRTA